MINFLNDADDAFDFSAIASEATAAAGRSDAPNESDVSEFDLAGLLELREAVEDDGFDRALMITGAVAVALAGVTTVAATDFFYF